MLPRPERLTELYFTDHAQLPTTYTASNSQTIKFTIHNLEHQTTKYRFRLIAQTANKEQSLSDDIITLAHGDSQDINQNITVPPLDRRVKIRVNLQYHSIPLGHDTTSLETQDIHYWVNRTG